VQSDSISFFQGDFLNKAELTGAVKDMEYVFHFISTTTPATSDADPLIDVETNIRMSIELFNICAENNVKRVIFASTGGSIYGEGGDIPKSETDNPLPVSPYAIGKLTIEHYLRYFKVKHHLDYMSVRISNPYGEFQALHAKQGVIPVFVENVLLGKPLTVLGDGSMERDYIYVGDVAKIISKIFDNPAAKNIYNIGSGTAISLNKIVEAVEEATGRQAIVNKITAPPTFIKKIVLDVSQLEEDFGEKASTTLSEGILKTCNYIKRELDRENQAV
jgi:UDP-glucose 4-epimerase